MCLGRVFSSKVFQCFFNILTLFGKKEQKYKKESYKSNNIIYKMYTKSHRKTNRKIISSSTPIVATLGGKLSTSPSVHGLHCSAQLAMTGLFMLTITWTTKSFWILVSCRRVLSVRSFPEKNHLWRDTSISSCSSSCFLSSAMESAMLAVRRTSFPEEPRQAQAELTQISKTRCEKTMNYTSVSCLDETRCN